MPDAAETNQPTDADVLALAKSFYLGPEPWDLLASSFRASLMSEAQDTLFPPGCTRQVRTLDDTYKTCGGGDPRCPECNPPPLTYSPDGQGGA